MVLPGGVMVLPVVHDGPEMPRTRVRLDVAIGLDCPLPRNPSAQIAACDTGTPPVPCTPSVVFYCVPQVIRLVKHTQIRAPHVLFCESDSVALKPSDDGVVPDGILPPPAHKPCRTELELELTHGEVSALLAVVPAPEAARIWRCRRHSLAGVLVALIARCCLAGALVAVREELLHILQVSARSLFRCPHGAGFVPRKMLR
jgi:hypothetical protein